VQQQRERERHEAEDGEQDPGDAQVVDRRSGEQPESVVEVVGGQQPASSMPSANSSADSAIILL
jgi:hypothetical protein